jgi:hypothetical protein
MAELIAAINGLQSVIKRLRNKNEDKEDFKNNREKFTTISNFDLSSIVVLIISMTIVYHKKENRIMHMILALVSPSVYLLWAMFIGKVLKYGPTSGPTSGPTNDLTNDLTSGPTDGDL